MSASLRGVGGQLLDVDSGLEALALGLEDHRRGRRGRGPRPAARRPAANQPGDRQRVHGRVVDRDDRDVTARFRPDHRAGAYFRQ